MKRRTLCAALIVTAAFQVAAARAGTPAEEISMDGFESGNTLGWDLTQPALAIPTVFRTSDLDLRDPHLFTAIPGFPGFGCIDFTDDGFPLGLAPSFNAQLEAAITGDADGDGLLDLARLLAFRPLDFPVVASRLDEGDGACTWPTVTEICDWRRPPVPVTVPYDGVTAGACLEPVAGTTSGYDPAVPTAGAACFVTAPRTATIDFAGVPLTLLDAQSAGRFQFAPPPLGIFGLTSGLQRGFLTEAAADATFIPADIPVIGGRPISSLLPGGTGSCAPGDDRDVHLGQSGWWFYFELEADLIGFLGA